MKKAEECYLVGPTYKIKVEESIVNYQPFEYIEQSINGQHIGGIFMYFDSINKELYYNRTNEFNAFITDAIYEDPVTGSLITPPIIGFQSKASCRPLTFSNELVDFKLRTDLPRPLTISNAWLLVDFIFLDTDERQRFIGKNQEFLIDQLQYSGSKIVVNNSVTIPLTLNNPVKEIIWTVQLNSLKNTFNYTNDYITDVRNNRGVNIIKNASLLLNGHNRMSEREGDYFNWVQPMQAHKVGPNYGIYVYSFSLFPEDPQPSGSINMSRIDDIKLKLEFDGTINSNNTVEVKIYATNYNIFRIIHGLSGLNFAS
jgi:hypothetical protein